MVLKLHYRGGMLKGQQLEITAHNAIADHLGGPSLFDCW